MMLKSGCKSVDFPDILTRSSIDSQTKKRRVVLTNDQAREIFKSKPSSTTSRIGSASQMARSYGVSPKTIRDIWVGRTWYWATYDLDLSKPASMERLQKKIGRPQGAKDRGPRRSKFVFSTPFKGRNGPVSVDNKSTACQTAYYADPPVLVRGKSYFPSLENHIQCVMGPQPTKTEPEPCDPTNCDHEYSGPISHDPDAALPNKVGREIEDFLLREHAGRQAAALSEFVDPFHSDLVGFWATVGFELVGA